jgi:hypothetical protein
MNRREFIESSVALAVCTALPLPAPSPVIVTEVWSGPLSGIVAGPANIALEEFERALAEAFSEVNAVARSIRRQI